MRTLGYHLSLQAGKGYSFSVRLDPAPRSALYLGDARIVASPIDGVTRAGSSPSRRAAATTSDHGSGTRTSWSD